MRVTFRFPGPIEYAFVEITTTDGSPADNERELRDITPTALTLIGNLLSQGCAQIALGPLQGEVIPDAYNPPQSPQEAQGYTYQPPAPPPPQAAPQGYYNPPQATPQPQPQPPGQMAPNCDHGMSRKFFPAGVNTRTNKPFSASWRCQANVSRENQCGVTWLD